jgi:DNA-binding beta-propeller fold protein YncE
MTTTRNGQKMAYERHRGWLAATFEGDVAGVAVNAADEIVAFTRGPDPIIVLDRDGTELARHRPVGFVRPHNIAATRDGYLCADDDGHAIYVLDHDFAVLERFDGAAGREATGYVVGDVDSIARTGPPFCFPTDAALAPDGTILVSDGYGNARVHRLAPDGEVVASWGSPGTAPGEFRLPHGVCVDEEGDVYVADRENWRVQVFTPDGTFRREWRGVRRPCGVRQAPDGSFVVTELGDLMKGPRQQQVVRGAPAPRITIRDAGGEILEELGMPDVDTDDVFFSPHAAGVDSHGDVYVGDVASSNSFGAAPLGPRLHRFARTA